MGRYCDNCHNHESNCNCKDSDFEKEDEVQKY